MRTRTSLVVWSSSLVRRVTSDNPIFGDELRQLAEARFGDLVKGVVDLKRRVLLLDADLHADQEAVLLAEGSEPRTTWPTAPSRA